MINDPVLEFEKRWNEPARYNRIQMVKTIQAMKKIDEIKQVRVKRLHERRMKASKEQKINAIENALAKHVDLIEDVTVKNRILEKIEKRQQEKEEAKEVELVRKKKKKMEVDDE